MAGSWGELACRQSCRESDKDTVSDEDISCIYITWILNANIWWLWAIIDVCGVTWGVEDVCSGDLSLVMFSELIRNCYGSGCEVVIWGGNHGLINKIFYPTIRKVIVVLVTVTKLIICNSSALQWTELLTLHKTVALLLAISNN